MGARFPDDRGPPWDGAETVRHLGNFPQAFSHLALVEATARLIVAEGIAEMVAETRTGTRLEPIGSQRDREDGARSPSCRARATASARPWAPSLA